MEFKCIVIYGTIRILVIMIKLCIHNTISDRCFESALHILWVTKLNCIILISLQEYFD